MNSSEENHLIFSEIINRYSPFKDDLLGEIFIKHFSHSDSIKIEKQYIYALNKAILNKLPLNSQKEQDLIKQGIWTQKEEDSIKDNFRFIDGMRENISREFLMSRRRMLKKEVASAQKQLESLLIKKDYLMGFTAEKYGRQQSTYHQIINSFYKDESLKYKFEDSELEDEQTYIKLTELYHQYLRRINTHSIRNIAISSFFMQLFHMTGENAYYFYGIPIVQLTSHQSDLFLNGRYFKSLTERYGDKIPDDIRENPEDMMEFFEITHNVEKSGILDDKNDNNPSTTSIIGATREDLKLIGIDSSQIKNIGDEIKKSGKGFLNKDDLFKLNG